MDAEFGSASALQLSVNLDFSLNIAYCSGPGSEEVCEVKRSLVFFRVQV